MYHSGIGGGGFLVVRRADGTYESVDFRETAPSAAFEDMFAHDVDASIFGGLASGVPGELRGLEYLHQHYAKLSWADLVQPSIDLARNGFPINDDTLMFMKGENFLQEDPAWAIDFAPNGVLKGLGENLKRERYADTLEKIAHAGADAFYTGEIASQIIEALQKANGTMNLQDLRDYTLRIDQPLEIVYRGFRLISNGVPSGGPVTFSVMKTIEGFEEIGRSSSLNISTHRIDEAMRFAFGERPNLGDPTFVESALSWQHEMISEDAARTRRNRMSDTTTLPPEAYNPLKLGGSGTSAIVVADPTGVVVSYTSSVNGLWGSKICVAENGIIMNNVMNDFSNPDASKDLWGLTPSVANFIRPGKRALSSILNVIVEHKDNSSFYFATAAAGGSHITTTGIEMLWHVLDKKLSAEEAIRQPRFHEQLYPNQMEFDWTYDNDTVAYLQCLGHNTSFQGPGYTVVQAVMRHWDRGFEAATEPTLHDAGASIF